MKCGQNNDPSTVVDFELLPQEETLDPGSYLDLTVHIKHDWYSEDTEHGRALLSSFMTALSDPAQKVAILLLSGSSVRMISGDHPLHDDLTRLAGNSLITGASVESMEQYGIDPSSTDIRITSYTAPDLAIEVIGAVRLITLE
ncbi:MAG: hypothetical protein J6X33_09970 [Clostridiales bacterium]|nr:hypothetical protein [Clostridiales bacterium]